MSDPAISAARKVFTEYWPDQGDFEFNYSSEGRFGIEVAREMAKSVRELHKPFKVYPDNEIEPRRRRLGRSQLAHLRTGKVELPPQIRCGHCYDEDGDPVAWPCETAKRVYPSEELGL
ncbi:Uncharacterised protein [Mycobacteroides abscessus subsp. abscessus]|uniref:hypothetical protein n=1 Tax=Mycobacteroides abscessus TaxID=36809 RepID=UPI00092C3919|nr:hypothetical protein [Mycobacteroides abscessus]SIJ95800.1 Uncharacterised protein [Mycobacteroides abscessus subsp. abscessus]